MFMRKIPNLLKVGFGVFHKSNGFSILNLFLRLLTSPTFWIQERAETSVTKQAGDVLSPSVPTRSDLSNVSSVKWNVSL